VVGAIVLLSQERGAKPVQQPHGGGKKY